MNAPQDTDTRNTITVFDLLIIVLSVYVLLVLIAETFFVLPAEISRVIIFIDNIICGFFLVDFCIRFYRAEDKLQFMKWGWIDLIASIPTFDAGRPLRIVRIIRILRAFRSFRHIVKFIYSNRQHGTFTTVAMISALLLIISAIAILQVETAPESNIKTAEDALWWAYVTITTVGYGDKFPVTTGGRVIAAVLMTAGVALFGTFTGLVSSWFVEGNRKEREEK